MDLSNTLFMKRMSKRAYQNKPVPEDVIERLSERIRWSPSCGNKQPWRVIFVTESAQLERVMTAMDKGNEWAAAAPLVAIVCAKEADDWTRPDNGLKYAHFDSGMGTMSLLLGVTEEGLMAHPTAGWDALKMKEIIGAPSDVDVLCVVMIGYPGSLDQLDERTRKKDEAVRTRKEIQEVIAREKWAF